MVLPVFNNDSKTQSKITKEQVSARVWGTVKPQIKLPSQRHNDVYLAGGPRVCIHGGWGGMRCFGGESRDTRVTAADVRKFLCMPSKTTKLILSLRNGNPTARAEAATKLGKMGSGALWAVGSLIKSLKDPEAKVRAAAALALGKIGGRGAIQVAKLLKDKEFKVQIAATQALWCLKHPKTVPALAKALLVNKKLHLRYAIIGALNSVIVNEKGELRDEVTKSRTTIALLRRAVPIVKATLKAIKPESQARIAKFFGLLKDKRGIAPLVSMLAANHEDTRNEAAASLATYGKTVIPQLLKALGSTKPNIVKAASYSLGLIGKDALPAIASAWSGLSIAAKKALVFQLGELADRKAITQVLLALKDKDPGVRLQAVKALSKRFDPEIESPLVAMLKDPNPDVRLAAAKSYEAKSSKKALSEYVRLLDDGDARIRMVAATHLGKAEYKRAAKGLIKLLEDPEKKIRMVAAKALGNMKEWNAGPALVKLLNKSFKFNKEPKVAIAAIEALGKVKNWSTVPALMKVMQWPWPNPKIRAALATALGELNVWKAWPLLVKLLRGSKKEIRPAATALGKIKAWQAGSYLLGTLNRPGIDAKTKAEIVLALGKIKYWNAGKKLSIIMLHDDDKTTATRAAWALGNMKYSPALTALALAINDGKADYKIVADILVRFGSLAVPHVLKYAGSKLAECDILGRIGDARAVPRLISLAKYKSYYGSDGEKEKIRKAAYAALVKIGRNAVPKLLLEARREAEKKGYLNDEESRIAAIRALGMIGDRSAVPGLKKCLFEKRPEADIMIPAIEALGKIGDKSVLPVLNKFLFDAHSGIQTAARKAIVAIKAKARK